VTASTTIPRQLVRSRRALGFNAVNAKLSPAHTEDEVVFIASIRDEEAKPFFQ
jgi:hypothetical protein